MKLAAPSFITCLSEVSIWARSWIRHISSPVAFSLSLLAASSLAAPFTLTWDDNAWDEIGFKIERAEGEGGFVEIGEVGANVTNFIDNTAVGGVLYSYRIRAYNFAGDSPYSIVVSNGATINAAPVNTEILTGNNAVLTVVSSGIPFPALVWQVSTNSGATWTNLTNSGPYSGVSTPTLTISPATSELNSFQYRAVAINILRTVNSAPAILTVNAPPTIQTHPEPQAVLSGGNTSFSITASGNPEPTYRWQVSFNAGVSYVNLSNTGVYSGALTDTLTITAATAGMHNFRFRCVITNSFGSTESANALLFVGTPTAPTFNTQPPANRSVNVGSTISFTASVSSQPAAIFQWQKNGENLVDGGIVSGATTSSLTLTGVSMADAATYTLVAQTLFSDPVSSAGSILVVNIPPAIVTQPVVQVVDLDGTASFSVAASGTPAPTYQWYRNGELIDGATESVYTIENVGLDNLGNYSVVVTNVADSIESLVVRLALRSAGNDINGDGSMDLLWQNRLTGHVYLWLMDGLARLPGGVDYGFHDINWVVAGIGDIDGDGQTDILWQNRATGHVYLWLMDGTTRRPGGVDYGFHAPEWVVAGVGDIDGDGHTDILWQNESTGHVYLWLMEGTTRRPGGIDYGFHEASWRVAGVGDLDGDGNNDILWQNNTTGHVFLWLMDGTVRRPGGIDYGFHAIDWKVAGVGDLNGDGHTDILWQNYATGHVYLWLMMSAVRVDGHDYGFHENNWRVAN